MKKKILIICVSLILVLGSTATCFAHGGGYGWYTYEDKYDFRGSDSGYFVAPDDNTWTEVDVNWSGGWSIAPQFIYIHDLYNGYIYELYGEYNGNFIYFDGTQFVYEETGLPCSDIKCNVSSRTSQGEILTTYSICSETYKTFPSLYLHITLYNGEQTIANKGYYTYFSFKSIPTFNLYTNVADPTIPPEPEKPVYPDLNIPDTKEPFEIGNNGSITNEEFSTVVGHIWRLFTDIQLPVLGMSVATFYIGIFVIGFAVFLFRWIFNINGGVNTYRSGKNKGYKSKESEDD